MTKWQNIRLWLFRQDGNNIFVAARTLDEARQTAGIQTHNWSLVECDLHMTEAVWNQRQEAES